jgi:hypothetical protein
MRLSGLFVCAILLVVILMPAETVAVCPNTTVDGEQLLWDTHACNSDFRSWFRKAFNLQEGNWDDGWGWAECNPQFAFPKMLNAGFLIRYGLVDEELGPWHNIIDYSTWASGRRHAFRFQPKDANDGAFATAKQNTFWFFGLNYRVEMNCPSFDVSAGLRAGTMLHEATHIAYWNYPHKKNNPGSNCPDSCSDDWFFHLLGDYPYGSLNGHKHSMNQIQIEFLCDLSIFHDPWVPADIVTAAGLEATNRMDNRILNPPGWTCGEKRPEPLANEPICPRGQKCCEPPTPPETKCPICVPLDAACP